MHSALGGHTVDNEQRVVVVESAYTANAYGGASAGISVGSHIHSRHPSLKGFHRVVFILLCQLLHIHHGNGTCQVGLALYGITGDNDLVQEF